MKDIWSVREVAGYWRLCCNGKLVATFNTRGAARAGLAVEKRRRSQAEVLP